MVNIRLNSILLLVLFNELEIEKESRKPEGRRPKSEDGSQNNKFAYHLEVLSPDCRIVKLSN